MTLLVKNFQTLILWLSIFVINVSCQLAVPSSVKGLRGGRVTLTCIPPFSTTTIRPTILWEKTGGGKTVVVASSVAGVSHISSATLVGRADLMGANFTINSLKLTDDGSYTCNVIALGSPQVSATTLLTVTAAPNTSATSIEAPTIDSSGKYSAATCAAISGKPRASIRWTNENGEVQESRESASQSNDGSWDVESVLLLVPGLLSRAPNSTEPITFRDRMHQFTCHVTHEDLLNNEEQNRNVFVDLMYSPLTHISLLANRLTCHAEGNPPPSVKWFLPNGDILTDVTSVYVGDTSSDSGRYACLASSSLKPDAVSTLDVQKAKDLPTLFRTLVRLETSLPTTASGYEIQCSAEVEGSIDGATALGFKWSRNDEKIEDDSYQITSTTIQLPSARTQLTSTLRFVDVLQGRDDATFQCRFVNASDVTGFVTAIERAVLLSVDYAPTDDRMLIVSQPSDGIVREGNPLKLTCTASSQPVSTYEWYFNGEKISTGRELTINGIHRRQGGTYRCLAYNYVPGSSHVDKVITVHYPPSNVVISEVGAESLLCAATSGSVPPPYYTWIYPNQSRSTGNSSIINLPARHSTRQATYVCVVSNQLGITSNASFVQLPLPAEMIGSLSVTNFIIIIVVCVIVASAFVAVIGWMIYRKYASRKSANMRAEETFKKYLQYTEPPESAAVASRASRNHSTASLGTSEMSRLREDRIKSRMENKSTIKEVRYADCRSPGGADATKMSVTSLAPPASCLRSPRDDAGNRSPKNQYRSYSEVDGSSIEIVENESLQSTNNTTGDHVTMQRKSNEISGTSPPLRASPTRSPVRDAGLEQYDDISRVSTLPCSARLANIRRDVARRIQEQTLIPAHYFPQGTIPRTFQPKLPVHLHPRLPPTVIVPGYDPILYDDTWRPGLPQYAYPDSGVGPYATLNPNRRQNQANETTTSEAASTSTAMSEEYLHGGKSSRPRSMSLSASYSSTDSNTTSFDSSAATLPRGPVNPSLDRQLKMNPSSRTVSPFDSGNDSVKSIHGTTAPKKQQSLTLV